MNFSKWFVANACVNCMFSPATVRAVHLARRDRCPSANHSISVAHRSRANRCDRQQYEHFRHQSIHLQCQCIVFLFFRNREKMMERGFRGENVRDRRNGADMRHLKNEIAPRRRGGNPRGHSSGHQENVLSLFLFSLSLQRCIRFVLRLCVFVFFMDN